jgi:PAS domain S-box-containing protein
MSFETEAPNKGLQLPLREAEILALAAKGFTDKQISAELGISRDTVGTYWRRILLRFGASSRTEVVARATESAVKAKVESIHRENTRLMEEIHSRSEAQARELSQRNLLAAVQEALLNVVSGTPDVRSVFNSLLSEMLALTQSEFGFIGELKEDEKGTRILNNFSATDISWDSDSQNLYEKVVRDGFEFNNLDNLFGTVVQTREVVISNNPVKDPRSGGTPEGHPEITAFLGLPVKAGAEMLGMIGIANRPGGYDDEIVDYLEPLTAACGSIIAALRAEEQRQSAEREATETLAQLQALLNGLHSAVMFVDAERKVRFVNAAFCNQFLPGLSPSEALGRSTKDLMDSFSNVVDDSEAQRKRAEHIIAHEESVKDEDIRTADGRLFLRDFQKVRSGRKLLGHLWYFREVSGAKR